MEVWLIFESETADGPRELIDVCPLEEWNVYPEKYRAEFLELEAARKAEAERKRRESAEREKQERLRVKWWQVWRR